MSGAGSHSFGVSGAATESIDNGSGDSPTYNENLLGMSCATGSPAAFRAVMPSDYWEGGSSADTTVSPCTLVSVHLPAGPATQGVAYSPTFDYAGTVDQIVVDPNDATSGTIAVAGGPPEGVNVDTDSTIVNATGSPQTVSATSTNIGYGLGPTATTTDPVFYCVAGGKVYAWGDGIGGDPSSDSGGLAPDPTSPNGGGSFDEGQCFASAGWSLDNPVSWVTGALHDGQCILEWLFIPANNAAAGLTSSITGHVPFMWVADTVDAVNTLLGGVTTGISAGGCDAPRIGFPKASLAHTGAGTSFGVTLPTPSSLGCAGASTLGGASGAGDLFGFRTLVRDVLALGLWLGVLLLAWRMTPWSRPGDGMEVFAAGGTIEGRDINGTEVFQTNEGSDSWGDLGS